MRFGAIRLVRLACGKRGAISRGGAVATVGSFDGLHLGHGRLFATVVSRAKALEQESQAPVRKIVVSFYPHPDVVLGKVSGKRYLISLRQKLDFLARAGIDELCLIRFSNELKSYSAAQFLNEFLREKLGVRHLVIGPYARVGCGGDGTPAVMVDWCKANGCGAEIVESVQMQWGRVSSKAVREFVASGNVEAASALLGRPYALEGRVIRGFGRGQKIGVPTINLSCFQRIIPVQGVYASLTRVGLGTYPSVTNIGFRPTFEGRERSIETHLFNYSGPSLYGERAEVKFVKFLRKEEKFPSAESLVAQIRKDIEVAKASLLDLDIPC